MSREPNLFIIGAMKSGTTSLHNYLNAHPDIAMSNEKEPGYFVEELSFNKGRHWYSELFESESHYQYRGESSTHYTKLPAYKGVPERLFAFNPNAKLIYIMRDPFERTISHYWHAVRDIHSGGELRPLLKAIQEKSDYLAFSEYALQLKPYIDRFGKDSVYTLTFESLRDDPNRELNKIFDWLGLNPHEIPTELSTIHNQKPEQIIAIAGVGILNRIQYSKTWDKLSRFAPSTIKSWAKKIAYEEIDESRTSGDIAKLKAMIGARQRRQIEALSSLLNRDFPEWSSATSPL